jgi:hypothetical protein
MSFSSPLMTVLAVVSKGRRMATPKLRPARALVPGLHDAVARAGDGHPPRVGHERPNSTAA